MLKRLWATVCLSALLGAGSSASAKGDELAVVPAVDLARFMGTWYETASMPNRMQKGCTDTVVYYRLRKDGGFDLSNTCWKGETFKPYRGTAKPTDPKSTAKFYVRFILFLGSPYWIIDLDPDYKYAAVGVPDRSKLWIISRESTLDPVAYDGILQRVRALGYDTSKLAKTVHTGKPLRNPFAAPEKGKG